MINDSVRDYRKLRYREDQVVILRMLIKIPEVAKILENNNLAQRYLRDVAVIQAEINKIESQSR